MGMGHIANGLLQRGYWAFCAVFTVNDRGKRDVKGAGRALYSKARWRTSGAVVTRSAIAEAENATEPPVAVKQR